MKWKCTACVDRRLAKMDFVNDLNKGCTIDVPHLDNSVAGPVLCCWDKHTTPLWEPMDRPIDKAIEAATPRACFWCDEPALVNDIGLCHKCETESEHDHAN